jgi:hypothetical protein
MVLDCEDSTVCGYASLGNGFRHIERSTEVPMCHGIMVLQAVFFDGSYRLLNNKDKAPREVRPTQKT